MYEVKDMDFAFGWWNGTFTEKHSFAKVSKWFGTFTEKHSFAKVSKKLIKTITFLSNLRKCLTKRYHHLIWGILCSKVLPNKKNPQLKWRHLIWGDKKGGKKYYILHLKSISLREICLLLMTSIFFPLLMWKQEILKPHILWPIDKILFFDKNPATSHDVTVTSYEVGNPMWGST